MTTTDASAAKNANTVLMAALGIETVAEGMEGALCFARQLGQMIRLHDSTAPDPDEVVRATEMFITLRTCWHPIGNRSVDIETMGAIQEAMRALGYDLDLDNMGIDFHTPEGGDDPMLAEYRDQMTSAGFDEMGTIGMMDASIWHAIVTQIARQRFEPQEENGLTELHRILRGMMINRIATGSFWLPTDGLEGLVNLAINTATDMMDMPSEEALVERSSHLRSIFDVEDQAGNIDERTKNHPEHNYVRHAAATICAIGGGSNEDCIEYVITLMAGSCTGLPHAVDIKALTRYINDAEEMLSVPEDQGRAGLEQAIATVLAAMTIMGRLDVTDLFKTNTIVRLVAEDLHTNADALEENVAVMLEQLDDAIRRHAGAIDDFLKYADKTDVDQDAATVYSVMDTTDPTPPPHGEETILPRALLVRMKADGEIDPKTLRRIVTTRFMPQPDAFSTFGEPNVGEWYWRLSRDGGTSYSTGIGHLTEMAGVAGIEQVSLIYRGNTTLGVTTIRNGGKPMHRLAHAGN